MGLVSMVRLSGGNSRDFSNATKRPDGQLAFSTTSFRNYKWRKSVAIDIPSSQRGRLRHSPGDFESIVGISALILDFAFGTEREQNRMNNPPLLHPTIASVRTGKEIDFLLEQDVLWEFGKPPSLRGSPLYAMN
ncbi:hypothetical protein CDAR_547991 [Caerostris darwini]|uniref:Uncharacterized protein n=1 Tax=Caerostris darwini TaxID=1538125 RepID=A0AAV4WF62_9ARAC|nr:hypothetical protein CDAR_547991 [Caerostris darwini]